MFLIFQRYDAGPASQGGASARGSVSKVVVVRVVLSPSPDLYVEILIPGLSVWVSATDIQDLINHGGGVFLNGISVSTKKDQRSMFALYIMLRT